MQRFGISPTVTFPQPGKPISLAYIFFYASYKKSRNIYGRNKLLVKIMKNKILTLK
jgi:hypothetical protein